MKPNASGYQGMLRRARRRLFLLWGRWIGRRGIIPKMILMFVILQFLLDYLFEGLLRMPSSLVDPVGDFAAVAGVYWLFRRDIDLIYYPEGAVGKGRIRRPPSPGKEAAVEEQAEAGGDPSLFPPPSTEESCAHLSTDSLCSRDARVLLVDENPRTLESAREVLSDAGIGAVQTLTDCGEVLSVLSRESVSVLLLGIDLCKDSGIDLVRKIRQEYPQLPVVVITTTMNVEAAGTCMKTGAFDYLVMPVEKNRFLSSVRRALEIRELRCEVSTLRDEFLLSPPADEFAFNGIRTRNRKLQAVCHYVEAVAASRQPVLITGETGVGKELIARAIHEISGCAGRFVAVNVAGLDDTMFSDTLFGHMKGAFTGADKKREGLLARASGGTLFLDEIGDLKESTQIKLLRLLEEKQYYPLGSDAPMTTDARIVCATHHCLSKLLTAGEFRKDLYFRLHAHHVHIPPLRERMEDLPLLLDHCLEDAAQSFGKKKPTPPPEILTLLSVYHFPGNVRELRSMVFDAVAQHRSGVLSLESFRKALKKDPSVPAEAAETTDMSAIEIPFQPSSRLPTIREAVDILVAEAMKRSGNNRGIAALQLGITREALNKRLARQKSLSRMERKEADAA
jgi:DNA-binding NtrC family response regulator